MLVLSRKLNEQIDFGESVRITVLSIRPGRVQIGIEAPGETKILRVELKVKPSDAAASGGR